MKGVMVRPDLGIRSLDRAWILCRGVVISKGRIHGDDAMKCV